MASLKNDKNQHSYLQFSKKNDRKCHYGDVNNSNQF